MSEEQQLERSVLERKERDELHAIAEAMSLSLAARTKKADIIDRILRAAGVETSAEPASQDTASAGATQVTNGAVPSSSVPSSSVPSSSVPPSSVAPSSVPPSAAALDGTDAGSSNGSTSGATAVGGSAGNGTAEQGGTANEQSGTANEQSGRADQNGEADSGSSERSRVPSAAKTSSSRGETPSSSAGADSATRSAGADSGDEAGKAGTAQSPGDNGRSRSDRQVAPTGGRTGSQDGSRGGGGRGQGDASPEAGNRRGRRRRGRDRDRGERDLQAGSQEAQFQGEPVAVEGLLDLRDEGFGFLRTNGYLPSSRDVYVSISQVRRFALRKGDHIEGASRPASSNEKYPALLRIDSVSSMTPDEARQRPRFEDLTPLFPDARLKLEVPGDSANMTARIVDLLSPIGKGQRGMIVSPPKAGKTTVMKQIAHSIEANDPEVHLMVLLVDERPEEVTDMRRSVRGEVVASTFDRPAEEHTAVAELAIERARRLVEQGRDVVIILDGITRLARAYNLGQPATGRIMSGGVDSGALYPPKKFFGAARNIEEGGSLTILATALVETGSRMDEVIFEEFKGTGNLELRLDRKLAERRIYPAIDVNASSTRHEELLYDRSQLQQVWKLRRVLNALGNEGNAAPGLELLMDKIKTTKGNDEFLAEIAKGPAAV